MIEAAVLLLGGINAFVLLVRPAARFHARLDFLEMQLAEIRAELDAITKGLYSSDR